MNIGFFQFVVSILLLTPTALPQVYLDYVDDVAYLDGYRRDHKGHGGGYGSHGGGGYDDPHKGGGYDDPHKGGGYGDPHKGGGYDDPHKGGGYGDPHKGGGYDDPHKGGGYDDPHKGGGYDDPHKGGGYGDPHKGGGYDDPHKGGGYDDPHKGGGYGDPHKGGGYDDPHKGGGYDDPHKGGGYGDPHKGGGYDDPHKGGGYGDPHKGGGYGDDHKGGGHGGDKGHYKPSPCHPQTITKFNLIYKDKKASVHSLTEVRNPKPHIKKVVENRYTTIRYPVFITQVLKPLLTQVETKVKPLFFTKTLIKYKTVFFTVTGIGQITVTKIKFDKEYVTRCKKKGGGGYGHHRRDSPIGGGDLDISPVEAEMPVSEYHTAAPLESPLLPVEYKNHRPSYNGANGRRMPWSRNYDRYLSPTLDALETQSHVVYVSPNATNVIELASSSLVVDNRNSDDHHPPLPAVPKSVLS